MTSGPARLRVGAMALLTAGALLFAGLVIGSRHPGGASAATTPTMTQPPATAPTPGAPLRAAPGAAGRPLRQPAIYTSHHGVLNVALVVSSRRVTIAGRQVMAKVYNGAFVAPTLVVSPGDLIRVRLVDHLDEPTNLHFHGLAVSPSGDADNVFLSINPGHSFQYSFRLPRTHPAGTYWYHSHEMVPMKQMGRFPNAGSEEQVFDGLSGLLEVRGLTRHLPHALRNVPERYLALRDVQVADGAIVDSDIQSNGPTTRLVDGQLQPRMTIAPGQTQLWHIGNVGADIFYRLSLPGQTFEVIAQDGHPVIHPRRVSTLLLPPGKRWDVLVRGGRAGTTPLRTLFYHEGDDNYPRTTLATLVTTGRAQRPAPNPGVISWASVNLARAHVVRRRVVTFSENKAGTVFFIDGQSYDPSKINFRARLNTVEQWTIVNHTEETHPFHMHTYPMQLMSVNGVPAAFDGYQDEIVLPAFGYVVMRVAFTGFTGETVFHCHILAHEDAGMMANILVTR
jgi:suppressor of ftsI